MFKDDYKNEIEKISADEITKQKVLERIKSQSNEKKHVPKTVIYRTAAAVAAVFALVISIWAVNTDNIAVDSGNTVVNSGSVSAEKEINGVIPVSYGEVYETVKEFIPEAKTTSQSALGALIDYGVDLFTGGTKNSDEAMPETEYVEEYATEDFAMDGSAESSTIASSTNSSNTEKNDGNSHSETTTQVEGVKEADVVKTDGEYIYSLSTNSGELRIIKAGREAKLISRTKVGNDDFYVTDQMYLADNKIVIIGQDLSGNGEDVTKVYVYDVSAPNNAEKLFECEQSGYFNDSRLIGDKLYLITVHSVYMKNIEKEKPETFVPTVVCGDYDGAVKADSIYINSNVKSPEYTVICGFSMADGSLCGSQSLLGGTYALYCNTQNIITAGFSKDDKTSVARFGLADGKIELKATGEISGTLLNQFSIDEYNGYFRFVTTVSRGIETREEKVVSYRIANSNSLYVLDSQLKQVGSIEDLAPDERVYSVRFMGDIAYFVTFRQVDPLFSADLSDPENPKIIGKLKIPGFSNYLYPFGEGKLLGIGQDADEETGSTGGIKLSMFDISDASNVTEFAKTVLDANYSESLYNHKATIIDYKKNIISFSVDGQKGSEYRIFTFKDGGFECLAEIELGKYCHNARGVYINNEFYVVTDDSLYVFDMNGYSLISKLKIN